VQAKGEDSAATGPDKDVALAEDFQNISFNGFF
jgi:hypothetical protein